MQWWFFFILKAFLNIWKHLRHIKVIYFSFESSKTLCIIQYCVYLIIICFMIINVCSPRVIISIVIILLSVICIEVISKHIIIYFNFFIWFLGGKFYFFIRRMSERRSYFFIFILHFFYLYRMKLSFLNNLILLF